MNVNVLMASGEVDEWEGAADAVDDRGSLVVLYPLDGDEVSGDVKTLAITRETEQPGVEGVLAAPEMATETTVFQVAAQYAPGMWMKVEFD